MFDIAPTPRASNAPIPQRPSVRSDEHEYLADRFEAEVDPTRHETERRCGYDFASLSIQDHRSVQRLAVEPSSRSVPRLSVKPGLVGSPPRCRDGATSPDRRGLQARVNVSRPEDRLEEEADWVADQVMRMRSSGGSVADGPVQVGGKCAAHKDEGGDRLDPVGQHPGAGEGASIVDEALHTPGQPLDAATRTYFERRFGHDFNRVRVHTDALAVRSARVLDAQAFTVGSDIAFDAGRFVPHSDEGRRLLAHELTHVVQQSAASPIGLASRRSESVVTRGVPPWLPGAQRPPTIASHEAFTTGASSGVHPIVQQEKRVFRKTEKRARKGPKPAAPPAISWEKALAVMNAVTEVMRGPAVEIREGLGYDVGYPWQYGEVSDQYRDLLEEWFLTANGYRPRQGKRDPLVTVRGMYRRAHLDRAIRETMPFVNELLKEGEPESTGSYLNDYFWDPIDRLRKQALEEEVHDMIAAAAESGAGTRIPDLENLTTEEKLKLTLPEAVKSVKLANTVANRFFGAAVKDTAKQAKLNALFSKFEDELLKQDPNSLLLRDITKLDLPAKLLFVKHALDGVQSILAVSDPREREKLFRAQKNVFGEAARWTEMVKVLEGFVSMGVALTGAATYTFAVVTGNATLANQALASGITRLSNVGLALNIIGAIHGSLVLIDPDASGEDKAKAAFELGLSGLGVAGRFIPALSGVAGPLALTLTVNFYAIKWIAEAAVQMTVDMMRGALTICFRDMKETATYVQQTALRLAIARELAQIETDPDRARELGTQADSLRWNLVEIWLKPYLKRTQVTNMYGMTAGRISTFEDRHKDPANYPTVSKRFRKLASLAERIKTDEDALTVATVLISTVASCFADAEPILIAEVKDMWEKHG